MAEKIPVNMDHPPSTLVDALAILDFQTGDEWAGLTSKYANQYTDVAIQIVEQHGTMGNLPAHVREWIHRYLWED